MLAYLFWHRPNRDVSRSTYELALARFHERLAGVPCAGSKASAAYRISETPWLGGERGYEDWYLIEASSALDELNRVAVSGQMEEPHAAIAALMETGHGGLYALHSGAAAGPSRSRVLWLGRPRGIQYEAVLEAFVSELREPVACWRRQMVLGPAPEFAVVVSPEQEVVAPDGWTAVAVDRTCLWPTP